MKKPRSFAQAFADSRSTQEVLAKMNMAATHIRIREIDPVYAERVEELIAAGLAPAGSGSNRAPSVEKLIKDLDRAATQAELPFPQEQIPQRSVDDLIAALEERIPFLWSDEETGEEITLREAMKSPELWRRALTLLHDWAHKTRRAANNANWCLCAAMSVEERLNILGGAT